MTISIDAELNVDNIDDFLIIRCLDQVSKETDYTDTNCVPVMPGWV
jgi:hypothetical protein